MLREFGIKLLHIEHTISKISLFRRRRCGRRTPVFGACTFVSARRGHMSESEAGRLAGPNAARAGFTIRVSSSGLALEPCAMQGLRWRRDPVCQLD